MNVVYLNDEELQTLIDFIEYQLELHSILNKKNSYDILVDIKNNLLIQKRKNY